MCSTVKIAVLMTCHNRRVLTLESLNNLFACSIPERYILQIFLVDDGSSDQTTEAVQRIYPNVVIIQGNGLLYWNQGMRLAWDTAIKTDNYDFYFWLNDDVLLDGEAITELLECYSQILNKYEISSIITGACRNKKDSNQFSYGGSTEKGNVSPNGELQECKYINGNAVLIPNEIYKILGNLSADYTHAMGDFDYGLRSINAGFRNYTTKKYIAICPRNKEPSWSNPNVAFSIRLKLFNSPSGLNIKEYLVFRKKHWGFEWIVYAFKAYTKLIVPSLYYWIKKL